MPKVCGTEIYNQTVVIVNLPEVELVPAVNFVIELYTGVAIEEVVDGSSVARTIVYLTSPIVDVTVLVGDEVLLGGTNILSVTRYIGNEEYFMITAKVGRFNTSLSNS